MIVRERKHWAEALDVLTHPDVYKWVTYEGYEGALCNASREWIGEEKGRVVATWQFHDFCPGVVNMHIAALPNTKGVMQNTRKVFDLLKEQGIHKIIAMIPADNIAALSYAERAGFSIDGMSTNVWPRNGLQDIIFYGKDI